MCGSALVQEAVAAAVQQARQQQRSLGELDAVSAALAPEFPTAESALELYGKPPPEDPDYPPASNQPPTAQKLQKFLTYDLHTLQQRRPSPTSIGRHCRTSAGRMRRRGCLLEQTSRRPH